MRYFIATYPKLYDLEQQVKKGSVDPVFQVVIKDSPQIKRFTWFLLSQDIQFERKSAGAGIAIFYVDTKLNYFLKEKEGPV